MRGGGDESDLSSYEKSILKPSYVTLLSDGSKATNMVSMWIATRRGGQFRPFLGRKPTHQLKAFEGINVSTLGVNPLKKPLTPCRLQIIEKASFIPVAFLISASELDPLVCSSVLATSRGVVTAPPTPPATAPAKTCVMGEYVFDGFIEDLTTSYVENWTAVKGTVITSVVGYER